MVDYLNKCVELKCGGLVDVCIAFDYSPSDQGDRDTPPSGSSVEIVSAVVTDQGDPDFGKDVLGDIVDDLDEACIIYAEDNQ